MSTSVIHWSDISTPNDVATNSDTKSHVTNIALSSDDQDFIKPRAEGETVSQFMQMSTLAARSLMRPHTLLQRYLRQTLAESRQYASAASRFVNIVEVGARDGLQNEQGGVVPTATKVELINRLSRAGALNIEAGSFVSPKWVPQMAGTTDVLSQIDHLPDVHYSVLVPNQRGLDNLFTFLKSSSSQGPLTDEISIFASATDAFTMANLNIPTTAQHLAILAPVAKAAIASGLRVRGYVSVAITCPFSGAVDYTRVRDVARQLIDMGCYEVSLGDTVGRAKPNQVAEMIDVVTSPGGVPPHRLAGHFHDTHGTALANVMMALSKGIRTFDASVGGLGGCPYSPGATGNIATEDILYALQDSEWEVVGGNKGTIDLEEMVDIGWWISSKLGRESISRSGRAIKFRREREAKEQACRPGAQVVAVEV